MRYDELTRHEKQLLSSQYPYKRISELFDRNEKHVIQETEDDIYFAWIGVIIAGEKEWSFYDDDVDDRMEILFTYLRELSKKVLEHKSKTGNLTYPFTN